MMKKLRSRTPHRMLPLYVNDRLTDAQRRRVERWLATNPEAREELAHLRLIERSLRAQETPEPSAAILARIRTQVRTAGTGSRLQPKIWGLGMLLGLLLAVLAFFAAPPVNMLAWSVQGPPPSSLKIYRAADTSPSPEFRLIAELAPEDSGQYRYIDFWLQPGRSAVYRIEAVNAAGETITSQVAAGNSMAVLPGQIALFGAGLIGIYGLAVLLADLRRRTAIPAWMSIGS